MSKEKDNTDALASSSVDNAWTDIANPEETDWARMAAKDVLAKIKYNPYMETVSERFLALSLPLQEMITSLENALKQGFWGNYSGINDAFVDVPAVEADLNFYKALIKQWLDIQKGYDNGIGMTAKIQRLKERIDTKIAIATIKQQLDGDKDLKVIVSKLHEISFERDARKAQYGTHNWNSRQVEALNEDIARLKAALGTENYTDEVSQFLAKYQAAFKVTFPNHFEKLQECFQALELDLGSQGTKENDAGADIDSEDDEQSFYDVIDHGSERDSDDLLFFDAIDTDPDSKSEEAVKILTSYQDSRKRKYHTDSQNFYYKQVVHNSFFRPRQTREEYIQELKNNINNYMRDPSNDENRIQLIQKIKEGERNYHSTHLSGTLREALQGVKETLCLNVDDIKPNEESDQTRFYSCKEVLQIIRWALQSLLESWQVSFKDESYSKKQPSCLSING